MSKLKQSPEANARPGRAAKARDGKAARPDERKAQNPQEKGRSGDAARGEKGNQTEKERRAAHHKRGQGARRATAPAGQAVTTYTNGSPDQSAGKPRKPAPGGALRVIPLGGLNEVGKNMTALEYGDDIIIVDCGTTFPDDELLGVDLVIPDITYLVKNRERVRGIVLTHAHEDHIGALPYVLRDLSVPVYCTALTAGLVSLRIAEHRNLKKVRILTRKAGDRFKLGSFDIEMIRLNHSVVDSVALAIKTPVGMVVATGDFKIDSTPISGDMIDLERFGKLGRDGVLLLMQDSTNAGRPGFATSERNVGAAFDAQFKGWDGRIIIATFASNVHRIQQIIDVAARYDRKVAVTGRSMENIIRVATELGYIRLPENTMVELGTIGRYPKEKMTIITTGSQGEPMSALYRMAFSGHKQVEIGVGDKVLIAAQPIPGNEKSVYRMINELYRRGAEVVYERLADIHVSGHACQEELKIMLALIKPRYFMPVHGEYRHLLEHSRLAKQGGMKTEDIFISEVGRVLEIDANGARFAGSVPSGRVLVDGYGVGDVGTAVLRDRKHLSQDGLIVVVVTIDEANSAVIAGPDIISRGFIFMRESEEIAESIRKVTGDALEACVGRGVVDRATLKAEIKDKLSDHLYKKTKRSPMILPIVMEV